MDVKPVKVAIIGCGNISGNYCRNLKTFPIVDLVACADMLPERAQARAAEFGLQARSVQEILDDPEIEIVVNLTVPRAHGEVALAVLSAGKSVYDEKPLASKREQAQQMLAIAREKGLLVGGAPDTFLGAGLQTCRKLIDDGWIGRPIAATAFMLGHGPEDWHPDPEFFYKEGAGPLFDMGPYYVTALANLIGPVRRVTGSAQISFPERVIHSQPRYGQVIKVEAPTHIAAVLDFAGPDGGTGAVGTLITSFDVWASQLPNIEIYGTEGSMCVPDPNNFSGRILVRRAAAEAWSEVPLLFGYGHEYRGVGVADMAYALRYGRQHRASGELAYHVLDVMHSIVDASREGRHIELQSSCRRPAPLPLGLRDGELDR